MSDNIIPLLVPFFVAGIVIEALVAYRRRVKIYHFATMMSDLSTGIVSQVAEVFLKFAAVVAYRWVYDHGRLWTFDDSSPWPWVVAFFGIDFAFYWWHRISHVVNFMWGVHVVHHHSEDFNLAVALRQPAFELVTAFAFYAPLAVLGVPAHIWVTMYALNLFYQFWTHTEVVTQLGVLERVLNTPSHHRVHHGVNRQYLDRNYGGIFIIWDRLFGTFEPEREPVVYGVTHPIRSFNPLWANVEYYVQLHGVAQTLPKTADRLRLLWKHPGWSPLAASPSMEPTEVSRGNFRKYAPHASPSLLRYVVGHFAVAFALSAVYMSLEPIADRAALIVPGIVVLATWLSLAGLLEGKGWAPALDATRQLAALLVVGWYGWRAFPGWAAIAIMAALMLIFAVLQVFGPRKRVPGSGHTRAESGPA